MTIKNHLLRATVVIVIVIVITKTYYDHDYIERFSKDIPHMERSIDMKVDVVRNFLERRINRVAQTQDEYQYSTSKRIDILEERIKRMEQGNINNNQNLNINQINIK